MSNSNLHALQGGWPAASYSGHLGAQSMYSGGLWHIPSGTRCSRAPSASVNIFCYLYCHRAADERCPRDDIPHGSFQHAALVLHRADNNHLHRRLCHIRREHGVFIGHIYGRTEAQDMGRRRTVRISARLLSTQADDTTQRVPMAQYLRRSYSGLPPRGHRRPYRRRPQV